MSTPVFGLYASRSLLPAQRAGAGQVLQLDTPVQEAGVTLFRHSYWLPVPPLPAAAQALRLAASQLQLRFAPVRFDVSTGNSAWFTGTETLAADTLRIDFAWPAEVVRVPRPAGRLRHAIELLRADGDAVADEATMTGTTGTDLAEPWVGSPLVVRVGEAIADLEFHLQDEMFIGQAPSGVQVMMGARAMAPLAGGSSTTHPSVGEANATAYALGGLVPKLTLAGRPTSPRLKLVAEQAAGSVLLWQAMLAGEQGTVTLPAQPVADEWAPALEQLLRLAADPDTAPTLLRLDIESDAPCTVTLVQLQLALQAEIELLVEPVQLAFAGDQPEEAPLPLVLPAGLVAQGLRLSGRVVADGGADAAAGAAPGDGRLGGLLTADQAALQPMDLAQPISLAGVSIYWQPLSDTLRASVRLYADGGNGPGGRVLVERPLSLDTPQAGWLAVRWPAIDLQAQRLWVEVAVVEGAGLWLFSGDALAGWVETRGAAASRLALPQGLRHAAIPAVAEDVQTRPIALRIDGETIAATLPAGALALEIPQGMLPWLATHPLVFTGGVRGSVTVESARLVVGA
jgi:hypothetical protein